MIGRIHSTTLYSHSDAGASRRSIDKNLLGNRIQELESSNLTIKKLAIEELASWKNLSAKAVPKLIQILEAKTEDQKTRGLAVFALGEIKEPLELILPVLIKSLFDEHLLVREDSAKALGKLGQDAISAIPALTAVTKLENEDPHVKKAAFIALDKIQQKY